MVQGAAALKKPERRIRIRRKIESILPCDLTAGAMPGRQGAVKKSGAVGAQNRFPLYSRFAVKSITRRTFTAKEMLVLRANRASGGFVK